MNRPLITHDDNYGTDYHYDNKKDKTRFDTNPIRWNEIWYNNEERSSIWAILLMGTGNVSTTQAHITKQYQKTDTVIAVITVIAEVGLMVTVVGILMVMAMPVTIMVGRTN